MTRRDFTVRVRNGYYEPQKTEPVAQRSALKPTVESQLAGVLPTGDLPLQLTAACFAGNEDKLAEVGVVLEAREPLLANGAAVAADVEVVVHAFDPGWKSQASDRSTVQFNFRTTERTVRYALLARLRLKPGRYHLRAAVRSSLAGRSGSVYYDLSVPDFSKADLSMSGIVLHVRPSVLAAPERAFRQLAPFVPTAQRDFQAGDQVEAFVLGYRRDRRRASPIHFTARVYDGEGAIVWTFTDELDHEQVGPSAGTACAVVLPISALAPGRYLLEIEAADGRFAIRREVRFSRR